MPIVDYALFADQYKKVWEMYKQGKELVEEAMLLNKKYIDIPDIGKVKIELVIKELIDLRVYLWIAQQLIEKRKTEISN